MRMKKLSYYLSIKGGTTTYAVLLATLSSILAGIITNNNSHWSFLFIFSIIMLLAGITLTGWLNIACISFNDSYSNITEPDREEKALYKTAVDDFQYDKHDETAGVKFKKKFNLRKYFALILSSLSIVLIVINNIQQQSQQEHPIEEQKHTSIEHVDSSNKTVTDSSINYSSFIHYDGKFTPTTHNAYSPYWVNGDTGTQILGRTLITNEDSNEIGEQEK